VEILNRDGNLINELKVAKMADLEVISGTLTNAVLYGSKINIEKDSDMFKVRIQGAANMAGTGPNTISSIILATVENPDPGYDDSEREMELQVSGNDLITSEMLLVSDDVDNVVPINGITNKAKNDPTLKIQLGGKVQITKLNLGGTEHYMDIKVPLAPAKKVEVDIVIIRDMATGNPVIPIVTVLDYWQIAKERYAQVGVEVVVKSVNIKDPPNGMDISDGLKLFESLNSPLTKDAKKFIKAYGHMKGSGKNIHVFYVKKYSVAAFLIQDQRYVIIILVETI